MLQVVVNTTLISVISGAIILILSLLLWLHSGSSRILDFLSGRKLLVTFLFALLMIVIPMIFSFSFEQTVIYVQQLLVSVAAVVSFLCAWWILDWVKSRRRDHEATEEDSVVSLFKLSDVVLDDTLEAFDKDEISEAEARERTQELSLFKWIRQEDETGYWELREQAQYGGGLDPPIIEQMKRLWDDIQRERSEGRRPHNERRERYLRTLLHNN